MPFSMAMLNSVKLPEGKYQRLVWNGSTFMFISMFCHAGKSRLQGPCLKQQCPYVYECNVHVQKYIQYNVSSCLSYTEYIYIIIYKDTYVYIYIYIYIYMCVCMYFTYTITIYIYIP